MQFGLAFRYLFDQKDRLNSFMMLSVCQLIPGIGPILTMGYGAEVAEALIQDPDLRRHPAFTFDRFVEYLTRGVWPFLVGLVIGLLIVIPMMAAIFVGIVIGIAANQPVVGIIIASVLYLFGLVAAVMLSVPMGLHAELTAKFDLGGAYRFALDFWKRVGGLAFTTGLVFIPLSFVVTILGLLCCFIGIYPANALIHMAAEHLKVQVYREYLARGGEPIVVYDMPEADYAEEDDRGE